MYRRALFHLALIVLCVPIVADARSTDGLLSRLILLRERGAFDEALEVAAALPDAYAAERIKTAVLAGVPEAAFGGAIPRYPGTERARALLWRGIAAWEMGHPAQAVTLLTRAIAAAPAGHLPQAHLLIGSIVLASGDAARARERIETALRQEPNLTGAQITLARAEWALGEYAAAWERLHRARISRPWDDSIPAQLRLWAEEQPHLAADRSAEAAARRAASRPPRVASDARARDGVPTVRVALAEHLSSVFLKPGAGASLRRGERAAAADLVPIPGDDAVLEVAIVGGVIVVRDADGQVLLDSAAPVSVVYRDPGSTTTIFNLTFGSGQFRSGREDRSYRGSIELRPTAGADGRVAAFTVINELSVEEYLYSVVPAEIPAWWPDESLAAQAIAARSYTLHPRGRFADRGFDLQSSVASAYYPGVSGEDPRTTRAVDATRGLVLVAGRRPLDAVYSANSAGYTESGESVWGWATDLVSVSDPLLPGLESARSPAELYRWLIDRPDSYSARAPFSFASAYRWTIAVPREEIEARLIGAGIDIGSLIWIEPLTRGITGRVEAVRLHGTLGTGEVRRDAIRSRLGGLRSNLFVVSPYYRDRGVSNARPDYFVFHGAGWGHGVGMDQTAAAAMAADGWSAEEILGHFYPHNPIRAWY